MEYSRIEVRDKKGIYDAVSEGLKRDVKDLGINEVVKIKHL